MAEHRRGPRSLAALLSRPRGTRSRDGPGSRERSDDTVDKQPGWGDQPPAVNGEHVVWARRNPDPGSSEGRGIFVATAPANPPAAAFADLAPDEQYRSAIEWLGEKGTTRLIPEPKARSSGPRSSWLRS